MKNKKVITIITAMMIILFGTTGCVEASATDGLDNRFERINLDGYDYFVIDKINELVRKVNKLKVGIKDDE